MSILTIDGTDVMTYEQRGKTDSFRVWLTWQFNGAIFLDAGTRVGLSAKDFSYNPKNLVVTCDINPQGYEEGRLHDIPNVLFKKIDVNLVDPTWLSKVDVIFLDISHNGDDEREFLERIEPHFKGVLVMDDVNDAERFPNLYRVFNDLDRDKYLLVHPVGSTTGTGIVPYGDWTIEIK